MSKQRSQKNNNDSTDMSDDEINLKSFTLCAKLVLNLRRPASDDEKLELYGLYKQSTEGNCKRSEPSRLSFADHAKWANWMSVKGTNKNDAMCQYIELSQALIAKYGLKS